MVNMMSKLNCLKIKCYGDKETIAEKIQECTSGKRITRWSVMYWCRTKNKVQEKLGINENVHKEVEADVVEVDQEK